MRDEQELACTAIRRVMAALSIAGDRQDAEMFLAQFADGATFELVALAPLPGFKAEGRDALRQMTENWAHLPKVKLVRHNLTTCYIEPAGETSARATSYFMVVSDNGLDHVGTYYDSFERGAAGWRFASRKVETEWASPSSLYFQQS